MSESLSNLQLKKRLLGAAILVLVAAIIIPFLLGEPKQLEAPVEEVVSTEFQSRIQPLNDSPGVTQTELGGEPVSPQNESGLVLKKIDQIQPLDRSKSNSATGEAKIEPLRLDTLNSNSRKKSAAEPTTKTAPASPVSKNAAAAPAQKKPLEKTQVVKKPAAVKSGWAVQVGMFSKKANAEAFAATLRGDGYLPKIGDAKSSSGKTNKRVWLGPFATKSQAKTISNKFEKQTGNDGYVAPYPFK